MQRALADPAATAGIELRVRCGLHAGRKVERRDHDYFGTAVNRAARVMSVAHGGQILLSSAVASIVRGRLPDGVCAARAGGRAAARPREAGGVSQARSPAPAAGVPGTALARGDAEQPAASVSSFVGREHELAEARRLLSLTRLLTLVGIGGLGKTSARRCRLAGDALDAYIDGVWFVELAPITDPRVVPSAVAQVLGVKERAGTDARAMRCAIRLQTRRLLLVLDNCEHLAQACADARPRPARGRAEPAHPRLQPRAASTSAARRSIRSRRRGGSGAPAEHGVARRARDVCGRTPVRRARRAVRPAFHGDARRRGDRGGHLRASRRHSAGAGASRPRACTRCRSRRSRRASTTASGS